MLIPRNLAGSWRGTTDPATGEFRELDARQPFTDYDRACAAAWPGRGVLEFMGSQVLVLYTEYDEHAWDDGRRMVACGGWLPSEEALRGAAWSDPIRWRADQADYLLMNSAADAGPGLLDNDALPVRLSPGIYTVDCADLSSESVGCFYRFIRADDAG